MSETKIISLVKLYRKLNIYLYVFLICLFGCFMDVLNVEAATNPYSGGNSNCTYTAWQKAYELTGITLPGWGNAGTWLNSARAAGFTVSSTPREKSIAVWTNGSYGHVAYVSKVSGNQIYVMEGGYLGGYHEGWANASGHRYPSDPNYKDLLAGYIYLDSTTTLNVSAETKGADNITATNAIVRGYISKTSSIRSGMQCGVQIGTASGNYNVKTYSESVSSAGYAQNGGAGFDTWFNINSELGTMLKSETKYYYRIFATHEGRTYYGAEKSFTTTDITPPTITTVECINLTKEQFTVKCTATDKIGVKTIRFYCWGPGQAWNNGSIVKDIAAVNGTATITVNFSDLKNIKEGTYAVDCRAFDAAGNMSNAYGVHIFSDRTAPTISDLKIIQKTNCSYTISAKVEDKTGIANIKWDSWRPGLAIESSNAYSLTNSLNNVKSKTITQTIDIKKLKLNSPIVYGEYKTKLYVYDKYGYCREHLVTIPMSKPVKENTDTSDSGTESNISETQDDKSKLSIKKSRAVIKTLKNKKSKRVVLQLKKIKNATGYEVRYTTNKRFKRNIKKVKYSSNKITIRKLKKGKTYYFKARAYYKNASGKTIYGKYSPVRKLKIRK